LQFQYPANGLLHHGLADSAEAPLKCYGTKNHLSDKPRVSGAVDIHCRRFQCLQADSAHFVAPISAGF
jgi:hypothetical protein